MNMIIGSLVLVAFFAIMAGGFLLILQDAGPTTSARLNLYGLLRRGGWKTLVGGAILFTIAIPVGVLWLAV